MHELPMHESSRHDEIPNEKIPNDILSQKASHNRRVIGRPALNLEYLEKNKNISCHQKPLLGIAIRCV